MIRLVHTADIHLDRCYSSARFPAAFANRRRQSLRDTFLRIVARAGEWPADALLIAGDLFEYDRVSRDTIAMVRQAFESVPHVPVFIAPGNHDPYVADSPYASQRWPDNVFFFSAPAWSARALDRIPLTVHGFGFDGPDISINPFGSLQIPNDGRVHVAVAHGSETGSLPPDKRAYAPFNADSAAPRGLRYLALGHYHGAKRVPVKGETWVQYSGSPEGHGFGETGTRVYVEIEIDGEELRVREVPSSKAIFDVYTIDCSEMESSQQIVEKIRALPCVRDMTRIARVLLKGHAPYELRLELQAVHDAVRADFDYVELVDDLDMRENFDELALEQTSLGAFVCELAAQLRDTTDPRRRSMLERAREIGIAAYRGRMVPLRGADRE